jgi:hypothetical protein
LGLAVVSLFVGLNVFLAGRAAELEVRIQSAERLCRELEWENAELVSQIALATNIEEIDGFARAQGFAGAQELVYLEPLPPPAAVSELAAPNMELLGASVDDPGRASERSMWQAVLGRFRGLVPTLSQGEQVASIR